MTRKWSFSTYGKSALGISIDMDFTPYLEKIEAAGNNVDEACKEAINAALPVVKETMVQGAERHRKTGDVVNAIEITPAKQQGNYIYGTVGIDTQKHPEAIEGVFQEYGDGHSPEFPDPFVRPAIDNNRSKIRSIEKKVLTSKGIPVENGTMNISASSVK